MSFSMNNLKSMLPGAQNGTSKHQHAASLEPEIGFQISIETSASEQNGTKTVIPELNVHLLSARHLPTLFGFKIVQGYLIKVKLFPGHKRLDSSIQTNSWPKFNETFKFPLAPNIKSSLKHSSSRRGSKAAVSDFTPEELFAGQFVVFTVYALLELPPTSFNRFSKTYRSLKDKSSNLMQNIFETSPEKPTDDKENTTTKEPEVKMREKRKSQDANPRDAMPPLTISESRRNLGSVTCYLQPKLFKRNSRGLFATEELWMPIKDITTTVKKPSNDSNNNLANSTKGVLELILEINDCSEPIDPTNSENGSMTIMNSSNSSLPSGGKEGKSAQSWNRMTSEVKRKMGIRNVKTKTPHGLSLKVTTARMRCTNKVKDELEATAGSVYVKTTVFEHGIYIDSWKCSNFYPSLSTKWEVGNVEPTITIPLQSVDNLDNILIRTTLATKTKMAKKLVLGTVIVGGPCAGSPISESGAEHITALKQTAINERVAMWHCYQ